MKKTLLCTIIFLFALSCFAQERLYTESELSDRCDRELYLMRNEIYARHGYVFSNEELQDYFGFQPWYVKADNNDAIVLNKIEQSNVDLIKKIENKRKAKYTTITAYFLKLKQALTANDKEYIKEIFGEINKEYPYDIVPHLSLIIKKIDFDDIHYYKKKGLHKVEVDNGFVRQVYMLEVIENTIMLSYNYMAHSGIIEGFDICTTYMSEDEYYISFNFEIDEQNNITYSGINIAG